MTTQRFSAGETAIVLAALRYWQREGKGSSGHERDIETAHGRLRPLSDDEIDALCERINFGDDVPQDVKVYIKLFHGRKYGEQLDDWGTQGPVFESDTGYFHTTYACEIKFGADGDKVLNITSAEDGGAQDCVYYDGVFYGDWSVFIVPNGKLDADLAARLVPFEPAKAEVGVQSAI